MSLLTCYHSAQSFIIKLSELLSWWHLQLMSVNRFWPLCSQTMFSYRKQRWLSLSLLCFRPVENQLTNKQCWNPSSCLIMCKSEGLGVVKSWRGVDNITTVVEICALAFKTRMFSMMSWVVIPVDQKSSSVSVGQRAAVLCLHSDKRVTYLSCC